MINVKHRKISPTPRPDSNLQASRILAMQALEFCHITIVAIKIACQMCLNEVI